jgi:putative membrane-bound dehydrogenase-like protein
VACPASAADDAAWHLVPIPESWERQPDGALATEDGYAWYRCRVRVPAEWEDQSVQLNVEPVDDARQTFINGRQVGATGTFPPRYRSGLGENSRHTIPDGLIRYGQINTIAVRTYMKDARSNFLVAAPILLAGSQAIRTEGQWQYRHGDDKVWAADAAPGGPDDADTPALYTQVDQVDDVELYLRRRQGDTDPLPPQEALASFTVALDLQLDQVLAEPHVAQPLFINWDERGRLWVLNYQQYPNPAGLKMLSRDKFLRTVYDKVPEPPPHGDRGRDNITIHEDTDRDGTLDSHKTFVDGLNIASSFACGRGGVFVLNPPYLLFYPDADADDVPDADPVVLLRGMGIEDSHSIANSLRWGPDGWLYACQGSTVTGQITRPGIDAEPIHSMGQLIWRYHPHTERFEVFAEGGGNTFGLEIDDKGRIFSGHNGGDTRGFHYVQGAYERKGFEKHGTLSNPYAFGYFPAMRHHSVPRFTHNYVIYGGATLPEQYHGRLFGIEPLQGQIVQSHIRPDTTTFQTEDIDRPVQCSDQWFRPVDIKVGPDGAIYVCDMYEQRIDHASHYAGRVTPETGRIYRVCAPGPAGMKSFDYARLSTEQLVAVLRHPNRWHRQTALRLIGDRRDRSVLPLLEKIVRDNTGQLALEALWALNVTGGLSDGLTLEFLDHADPYVRLWTARLAGDDRQVSAALAEKLVNLAGRETSAEVRSQFACTARRLPADVCLPIVQNLLTHSADADDLHIPLLLWWAIQSKAGEHRELVVNLFRDPEIWSRPLVEQHLLDKVIRRYALAGSRQDLLTCAELLTLAPSPRHQKTMIDGFETAYAGRSLANLPDELLAAISMVGGGSISLQVRQGLADATREALDTVADATAKRDDRLTFIRIFGEVTTPAAAAVLLDVVVNESEDQVREAALLSLGAYADEVVATRTIELYPQLDVSLRSAAQSLLASRRNWALQLMAAVDAGQIDAETITDDARRKLLLHNHPPITELVEKYFGEVVGATTAQMQRRVDELHSMLSAAEGAGNPYPGKVLYQHSCGKCHTLFAEGGQVGPDLTAFKRDDVRGILLNVVNPSAEIREGFENYTVATTEGRIVTGFIADQDNQVVVLRGIDGLNVVLPRDDIEEMVANPKSVMPEGILDDLTDQQIQHLFAYLRSTQPLAN